MTAGITALCHLGAGPLPVPALAALGLPGGPSSFAGCLGDSAAAGWSVCDDARATFLIGNPGACAAPAIVQPGNGAPPPAVMARMLLDRHGADLPAVLSGEWTLLDWQPGRLRLVQSRARGDWCFVARRGDLVAIAPDLASLARIDWIGRELDPLGLAGALGRGPLRSALDQRSILPGVERLGPGECWDMTPGETRRAQTPLPEPETWRGTFAEAVSAAHDLLGRIIAEQAASTGRAAVMLSGGLDSSTLAALLAEIPTTRQGLIALTSVAPPHSGLIDELAEAAAAARHLGIEHVPVWPDPAVPVYRPDPEAFRLAGGPSLSPRHYLYRAIASAARDRGAEALFDGAYGELTLTSYMPLGSLARRLRMGMKGLLSRRQGPDASLFHVRLAPHRNLALAGPLADLALASDQPRMERSAAEAWGYFPGIDKALAVPTCLDHGLRARIPFRDPRLLQLFAGFPAAYLVQDGLDRAPARAMMAGRLPETIRLRQTVGPFSPDYMARIGAQAGAVLDRFGHFRQAEADDWLDLEWLESTLRIVGARGPASIHQAFEVQMTAMAAEFLVWWRGH